MDGGKIMTNRHTGPTVVDRSRPLTIQHAKELQHYGTVARLPIAPDASACRASIDNLNQLLADTMTLRDMHKNPHCQVSAPTFYPLHLLFDNNSNEHGPRL